MAQLVLGIDEAGRGPVVGPMLIVGAVFKESDEKKLKDLGVKDSKLLTPKQREFLFDKIIKIAVRYTAIEVSTQEIDMRYAVNTNLNKLEAAKYVELINELKPDVAIIDCPSPSPKNFQKYMEQFIVHKCKLKCENYADKNYVFVGAASVIAKVIRDKRIKEIETAVGFPIGVGYPHDPLTIQFVEKALKNKEWLNKYIRKSWMTVQRMKDVKAQKKLGEFDSDDS